MKVELLGKIWRRQKCLVRKALMVKYQTLDSLAKVLTTLSPKFGGETIIVITSQMPYQESSQGHLIPKIIDKKYK